MEGVFGDRIISPGLWSARSPDLIACDILGGGGGNFKDKVYRNNRHTDDYNQWCHSPDWALASLTGFMIVCSSTMWGYQLHDRPVLYTLIQPSETSSSKLPETLVTKQ
jgi:hypothetical protein